MSSRKRKKRSRGGDVAEGAAAEAGAPELEAADEQLADEPEPEGEGASESEEPEPQPAVSEISELKPGRKRKRGKEEPAPEPEPAAAETDEPALSEEDEEAEEEDEEVADTAKEPPKTRAQLKRVLESLIFVSDQVITAQQLGRITKTKVADVREVLAEITLEYQGRGIELVEVNGGYQFRSAASSAPYVRVLVAQKPVRLTRAQLETLALIAYRQPITRPEVDDVRGVDSGSAIKVLLDRELIKILGRKDDAGRPLLYGTTPYFLEFFGMSSMQELPTLREFTELSEEHRELFKAKTNDIGDPSAEAEVRLYGSGDNEVETVVEADDPVPSEPEPEPEPEPDLVQVAEDAEETQQDSETHVAVDVVVDAQAHEDEHGNEHAHAHGDEHELPGSEPEQEG